MVFVSASCFFSPVDMCKYVTYTPTHTQEEIPKSFHSGHWEKAQCLGTVMIFLCVCSPLLSPSLYLPSVCLSLCAQPPPCIYFAVMWIEPRPFLPLSYKPSVFEIANWGWLQFLPQTLSIWNYRLHGHTWRVYSFSQNNMYYFFLKVGKNEKHPVRDKCL